MSSNQSFFLEVIATRAEKAYKNKDWETACKLYDDYFRKLYKSKGEKMSLKDALKLAHYAESIYGQMQSQPNSKDFDQEDVDTVAEYLLSARKAYDENPDQSVFPLDKYIDTYELLGQVALKVNQFKLALKEFSKGYQKAAENNCNWRIKLSLLFNKVIALEMLEKPRKAIATIDQGIELINDQLSQNPPEDQVTLLNEFKEDIQKKRNDLQGDIKEQEDNKDTIIEEEEDDNEEEENGENPQNEEAKSKEEKPEKEKTEPKEEKEVQPSEEKESK